MEQKKNKKELGGFLKAVERIGNKLPHPAMIFVILAAIVVVVSHFVAKYGEPVTYFDARAGEEVTKSAVSLMNAEGVRYMFTSAVKNFTGFAPLGTVLVGMLGVGLADYSGLFDTSLRKLLSNVNPNILTALVVFAGIMSNIASDAGYVIVVPLGAIIFLNAGRHPMAGMAAAFAGVSGGFSANLLLGTTDPLLTDITNAALVSGGIDMHLAPTCNYWFMAASTILLTIVGTLVTEFIVEKNLGEYTGEYKASQEEVTAIENKALRNAGISILIFIAIMAFMMVPKNGILRTLQEDINQYTLKEFISKGLIPAMMLAFMIPGIVYGKTVGKINDSHDLVKGMTVAMKSMGGYLVLAFFASQFVAYFGKSNLGILLSYKGAEFLESIKLTGLPLIIIFILVSAFLNLFMGSASAKWAIMAPIFVPMMYQLGLSPALTQAAYRIGDSTTNIITPLMSYFAMIVVFFQKYDEDAGLGTVISIMIPYTLFFLVGWIALMAVFVLAGIPVGIGAPLFV
ncbi:MAG: AbgT family transporter [Tissierellia bacterium]|nr:AbgT family transporter [Tissierellia bacterium]